MNLFNFVMDTIHQPIYDNPKKFEQPGTVMEAVYCIDSGMAPGPDCKLDLRGSERVNMGYYVKGLEPTEQCTVHVLVDFCGLTERVAGPGCPRETVRQIALIREEKRAFERNLGLPDAGYTYRNVPGDYIYPSNPNVPFYINIVPEGEYVGSTSAQYQFNGFCNWHNPSMSLPLDERPVPEEPTEPPTEPATIEEPPNITENPENNNIEPTVPPETTTEPPIIEEPVTEQPTTEYDGYVQPPPHIYEEITVASD
jgi:hypothetical protein